MNKTKIISDMLQREEERIQRENQILNDLENIEDNKNYLTQ